MNDIRKILDARTTTPKGEILIMSKLLTEKISLIEKLDTEVLSKLNDDEEIEQEILMASEYQREMQITVGKLLEVLNIISKTEEGNDKEHPYTNDGSITQFTPTSYKSLDLLHSVKTPTSSSCVRRMCRLLFCAAIWTVGILMFLSTIHVSD